MKKALEDYSIFQKWYKFSLYLIDRVEKFPKISKFTFGDRIIKIIFDIQELIIEAIYSKNKLEKLYEINISLEKLRIYIRMCNDRLYISLKQYEHISFDLNEVGKMVGGWIKSCKE